MPLPEGGMLQARRTDKDFFSGDIKYEMYRYLEYSRFALADISGLNFNVAYEIGARHRARATGTAIFRLTQFAPPFDINSIKAFISGVLATILWPLVLIGINLHIH